MLDSTVASPGLLRSLGQLLSPDRVSSEASDRVAYARDLWPRQQLLVRAGAAAPCPPAVVVWPESTKEVARVIRFAREHQIPIVPFGAGSGVCGGIRPGPGAIVMDVKRMRKVHGVDEEQLTVRAEAGILGQHLEDRLLAQGMTLGHYPSSISCSTLGGWIAARSAGQCSGRYGKMEDMLVALDFVDGRGEPWAGTLGGDNASILPLVTGSEGIFGVITAATLRISHAPAERYFASSLFPSTLAGLQAIREMYQQGLRPAVARLYDPFDTLIGGKKHDKERPAKAPPPRARPGDMRPGLGTRALVAALRRPGALNELIHGLPDGLLGGAMLVLVWEDDGAIGHAEREEARVIARRFGGEDTGEGPARKWLQHRHSVSYRQSPIFAGGGFADTMEVAAPWSRLAEVHEAVRRAVSPHLFVMAHFSHAYSDGGSIYFTFAGAAHSHDEALERYDAAWRGALAAAVAAGGTLSHHHGVGFAKAPFMRQEQGAAVDVVRALRGLLDPAGVLNPGTLLPREDLGAALREEAPGPENARGKSLSDAPRGAHGVVIDRTSLLARVEGDATLRTVEAALRGDGLTLALAPAAPLEETVRGWLDEGAPGARALDLDPTDQLLAGVEVELPSGASLLIRPAPRRAVGPDLLRAMVGARGACGVIRRAWLVARPVSPMETVAYLFDGPGPLLRARAALRARGVRALHATVDARAEGHALRITFDGPESVRGARRAVAEDLCRKAGGVPFDAALVRDDGGARATASGASVSDTFLRLLADAARSV